MNAKKALTERGRIFLVEMVLSETSPHGSLGDINLMVICGGRERTLGEWNHILHDVGLEIRSLNENMKYGKVIEIRVR